MDNNSNDNQNLNENNNYEYNPQMQPNNMNSQQYNPQPNNQKKQNYNDIFFAMLFFFVTIIFAGILIMEPSYNHFPVYDIGLNNVSILIVILLDGIILLLYKIYEELKKLNLK